MPLNITAVGDAGAYTPTQSVSPPDVVASAPVAAAPEQQRASTSVNEADVADAVSKLNDFAKQTSSSLDFSQDKETGQTIVKVVDTTTNAVILQIPSEEAINRAKSIEKMQGVLINHKA